MEDNESIQTLISIFTEIYHKFLPRLTKFHIQYLLLQNDGFKTFALIIKYPNFPSTIYYLRHRHQTVIQFVLNCTRLISALTGSLLKVRIVQQCIYCRIRGSMTFGCERGDKTGRAKSYIVYIYIVCSRRARRYGWEFRTSTARAVRYNSGNGPRFGFIVRQPLSTRKLHTHSC